MNKLFINAVVLTAIIFISLNSPAQEPPVEWGKISVEDLKMTKYPADTNASAVILCDFGETYFNNNANLVFNMHRRVKILSAAGYDWASHSVIIYSKKGLESIEDIEGVTYSLDESNNIVETELDDDEIYEEEIDKEWTKYKFTLPALKPGCIVEFRYQIESGSIWRIRDWKFQHEEPVVWSEYRIRYPRCIAYAAVTRGFELWAVNTIEEVLQTFQEEAAAYFGNGLVKCKQQRWAVQNIRALRDEPFITTIEDYQNKVEIQLAGYAFPGAAKYEVLRTWKSVVEELLDAKDFYRKIDDGSEITILAQSITGGLRTQEEKMKAIYDWVSFSIIWNGEEEVFAGQDVDDVLEYKKGNSAEITFLLISLLRSAGITADPVILSTRDNGLIQNLYPIVSQFNYVITRAKIGNNSYFLDANNPLRPYDLMPFKILNVAGLVIKKGEPEWVGISWNKQNLRKTSIQANINEEGFLYADIEEMYSDYKALNLRNNFKEKNEHEIVKELYDSEASGLSLDTVVIQAKDSIYEPLIVKSKVSSENYCMKSGDIIYYNPSVIHRMKDNPFKSDRRTFPIDYGHPSRYEFKENIKIPVNYEIKESLSDKNFKVSPNIGSYTRQVLNDSGNIRIIINFEIKESLINPKFYDQLKSFYAKVVASESEQFVFARKKQSKT